MELLRPERFVFPFQLNYSFFFSSSIADLNFLRWRILTLGKSFNLSSRFNGLKYITVYVGAGRIVRLGLIGWLDVDSNGEVCSGPATVNPTTISLPPTSPPQHHLHPRHQHQHQHHLQLPRHQHQHYFQLLRHQQYQQRQHSWEFQPCQLEINKSMFQMTSSGNTYICPHRSVCSSYPAPSPWWNSHIL